MSYAFFRQRLSCQVQPPDVRLSSSAELTSLLCSVFLLGVPFALLGLALTPFIKNLSMKPPKADAEKGEAGAEVAEKKEEPASSQPETKKEEV